MGAVVIGVCLGLHELDLLAIAGMLNVLVAVDERLYRSRSALAAPWSLTWQPDELVACDDVGCRTATISTQVDAIELARTGRGSCGSLAAAYAGYMRSRGRHTVVRVYLIRPRVVHAVAVGSNGTIYDPAVIGRQTEATT